MSRPAPAAVGQRPAGIPLLTVFGLGHLRPAPGTWGSLPPVALAAGLVVAGLGPAAQPLLYNGVLLLVLVAFVLACAAFGDVGEAYFGRKDASQIVADETAGQCIPLLLLPAAAAADMPTALFGIALAFIAFRLLDIAKPWPANVIQRVPGGWGVVLDDLVAGVYAWAVVQVAAAIAL